MPVANYYTVEGQMIGYKTATGRKDFLTDTLGSVTAEVDQTGNTKTFDGRYKPYGGDLSSTGTRGRYGWVGSWGYRETNLPFSSHYIRARHYEKSSSQWLSQDSYWPDESSYGYVSSKPTTEKDPSGFGPKYKVGYEKLSPWDIRCACDTPKYTRKIKWTLKPMDKDGFIVQKLTLRALDPFCDESGSANEKSVTGFEAWEVKGGKIYNGFASRKQGTGTDLWQAIVRGQCRAGYVIEEGHAMFFPGLVIKIGVGGWEEKPDAEGHLLPTNYGRFSDFDLNTKSDMLSRTVTMSYDCCHTKGAPHCKHKCKGGKNNCTITPP